MKRLLWLLLLPVLLGGILAPTVDSVLAQSDELVQEDINRIASTVVYILTYDRSGPFASGSGTLVTPTGLIYTNRHVIEDGIDFEIALLEDMAELPVPRYYASLVYVSDDIDFAVLQIDRDDRGRDIDPEDLDLPYLDATTDEVGYGEPVYIFGYPDIGDGYMVLTRGSITTIENGQIGRDRLPVWYRTDAEMSSGNSGGLVVNGRGEYVGIPTWVRKADSTLGQLGGILPYPAIVAVLDTAGDLTDRSDDSTTTNRGGDSVIVFANDSRETICYLYFSPTTSTEWGSNLLSRDLEPGDTVEFDVDPGEYDLLLQDCDKDDLDDVRDIVIDDELVITYSRSGIDYEAPAAPQVEQFLEVEVQDIEYDHVLEGEDEPGLMIYTYIRASGYQDVPLRVALFYYYANGDPMSGENAIRDNRTPSGNLTIQAVITPEYEDTEWDGFWFWMPYSAFPDLRRSKEEGFIQIEIGLDGEEFITVSEEAVFTLLRQD